jgi:colanic acid biosynthesis glycosyl transferase WcaI
VRILIYSINYFPELTGIGKYNGEMADWLANQGHEVVIITAPPYYPWWRVQQPYRSWIYRTELINKVKVHRCPLLVPSRPTGAKRLLHLFSFALTSIPVLLIQLFKRPDIIVVLEPTLFCVPAALGLARLSGARTWLHVQDFEVDAAWGLGLVKAKAAGRTAAKIERWLMNCFDRVSTISDSMLERLVTKGIMQEKTVLLSNWVDAQDIFPLPKASIYRAELGIEDNKFVALYSGNMGEKQGLEILLAAARSLQAESRLLFVLCGTGAARARLMQIGMGLHNVRWLPLQPVEKLNELLNLADVHLLPQRADAADWCMPSKLLGMLASGRPVLATAHPGTQLAKMVSSCGKVVEPDNAQKVAQGLLEFLHAPQERERLGVEARKAAQAWDKSSVLRGFENQLLVMCNR